MQILAFDIDEAHYSNGSCNTIADTSNVLTSVEKQAINGPGGKNIDLSVESHDGNDERGYCSNSMIQYIMDSLVPRCDYYNISHSECVKWIGEELESSCSDQFNCIETSWDYATYRHFAASTN